MKVSDMTKFNIDFKESLVHFSPKRRKILQFKVCTTLVWLTDSGFRKNILLNKKTKIRIDYLKLQTILASVNQDALSKDKLLKAQTQLNVCQLQC